MSLLLLALLLAPSCTGEAPVSEEALMDALSAGETLESCEHLAFEEMAVLCRVRAASRAGRSGDAQEAQRACEGIEPGRWREECHFRAGEELGRGGFTDRALRHCAQAGEFSRFCLTHTAWGLPPLDGVAATDPPERVTAAMLEFSAVVRAGLSGAPEDIVEEGEGALRSRVWFHLYFGSGHPDPDPAREAPEGHGPAARTGLGYELARLGVARGLDPKEIVAEALAVWEHQIEPPTGEALPPHERLGRYSSAVLPDNTRDLPHVATFGGGLRLVAADPREDLELAVLEGLYFSERVPPTAFEPWLNDPRDALRWTATKLFGLAGGLDHRPELPDTLTDPTQRAYLGITSRRGRPGDRLGGRPGEAPPKPGERPGPQGPDPELPPSPKRGPAELPPGEAAD